MSLTHLLKDFKWLHKAKPNSVLYTRDTSKTEKRVKNKGMYKNITGKWRQ